MKIPAQIQHLAFGVQRLVFVFFLFSIFYFLFTIGPVSAQTTNPDVPNNLHTWTQNVMIEVMAAATCQLAGVDPINPNQKCLGVDPKTNSIGFVPSAGSLQQSSGQAGQVGGGGAIGLMGNLIALTYTPPLHTGDYFSYLAQNFGIAKPAYAAGTGFEGLKPLMNLWIAFRNIVYLAFVLVFVVIGVAIMLRVKIDPRTVMTIENQIPKIIIGLLLVTFSFAIAGFLIDLMWVSIYLVFSVISGASSEIAQSVVKLNPATMQGQTPLDAVGGLGFEGILGLSNNIANAIVDMIRTSLGINLNWQNFVPGLNLVWDTANTFGVGGQTSVANWIINFISVGAAAGVYFNIAHIPSPSIFGWSVPIGVGAGIPAALATHEFFEASLRWLIPYLIAFLIVYIAMLYALTRLWFELIKAYIFILIDVVLAPFFIVAGLLPGSPISFGAWLRDILANLSAFPVTIAMFLLGKVFMDSFGSTSATGQFLPPLIGNPGSIDAFKSLIGLGVILMTPQVVEMMKTVFKAPKLDTSAIGRAVGVGRGVLTAPAQPVIQAAGFLGGQQFLKKLPGPIGGFFKP